MRVHTPSVVRSSAFAQEGLQLGEDLLDGIEIGRVGGQKEEARPCSSDHAANGAAFVRAEVVHDDDIARLQGRQQELFHVDFEALAVDGAVNDAGSRDAIVSQGGEEGHGAPMAMRHLGMQRRTAAMPAMGARHVGLGPGLVDEDEACRIDAALMPPPPAPPPRDVRSILLAGEDGFF